MHGDKKATIKRESSSVWQHGFAIHKHKRNLVSYSQPLRYDRRFTIESLWNTIPKCVSTSGSSRHHRQISSLNGFLLAKHSPSHDRSSCKRKRVKVFSLFYCRKRDVQLLLTVQVDTCCLRESAFRRSIPQSDCRGKRLIINYSLPRN